MPILFHREVLQMAEQDKVSGDFCYLGALGTHCVFLYPRDLKQPYQIHFAEEVL
jgi:hypothetical protein